MSYKLVSKFKPMGDQPEAIKELVKGIHEGKKTVSYTHLRAHETGRNLV